MNVVELFATALLLNHYDTLREKAQLFLNVSAESPAGGSGGIFFSPICTLFSTSCDPHVTSFIRKRELNLYATRPIKKGEQVSLI